MLHYSACANVLQGAGADEDEMDTDEQPQYSSAVFLLKYQMISVMESLKRMLA